MTKNIIAILLFFAGLATLLSLGVWQIKRLAWKNAIIEKLESEYNKNPLDYVLNFKELNSLTAESDIRYGSIRGTFDYKKQIFLGPKTLDGQIGYWIITPFALEEGGYVLVHRGWIGQENKAATEAETARATARITGIFRKAEWSNFTPQNSPANNIWTRPDIKEIAEAKQISPVAPVLLYAENITPPQSEKIMLQAERWLPRNKHKQYAIFWFGMAGVLIIVFALALKGRNKA